jgi:PemK-like, MazF-like toxin of type II toxin-antitoxin system
VVSTRAHNDAHGDVVFAMITSSSTRLQFPQPGDFVIDDWRAVGLLLPSVVRTARLLVLEHREIGRVLGDLTPADLRGVDAALRLVLGL